MVGEIWKVCTINMREWAMPGRELRDQLRLDRDFDPLGSIEHENSQLPVEDVSAPNVGKACTRLQLPLSRSLAKREQVAAEPLVTDSFQLLDQLIAIRF